MSFRILVIDDDQSLAEMIQLELEDRGFSCTVCETAEEAQSFFQSDAATSLQGVLCDYMMPGQNGLELLAWCQEKTELVPFVLLTGFGDLQMAEKAMDAGAFDFMRKPFNTSELVRSLTAACQWGTEWNCWKDQFKEFLLKKGNNSSQNRQLITQLVKSGKKDLIQKFLAQRQPAARAS
jgi:DNA-binding NtrC family response regulator